MKCKMKPVTNSSSTSYSLWGGIFGEEELSEKFMEILKNYYKVKGKTLEDMITYYEPLLQLAADYIHTSTSLIGVKGYESNYIIVGSSPFDMKGNQTLDEYKKEICDKFGAIGFDLDPKELRAISETVAT